MSFLSMVLNLEVVDTVLFLVLVSAGHVPVVSRAANLVYVPLLTAGLIPRSNPLGSLSLHTNLLLRPQHVAPHCLIPLSLPAVYTLSARACTRKSHRLACIVDKAVVQSTKTASTSHTSPIGLLISLPLLSANDN